MLCCSFCGVHGMYASFFEPLVRSYLYVYDIMLMKISTIFLLKITAKTFYFFSNLLISRDIILLVQLKEMTEFLVRECSVLCYRIPVQHFILTLYVMSNWCLSPLITVMSRGP
jgi:hypothetical protein